MNFNFQEKDIQSICKILNAKCQEHNGSWTLQLTDSDTKQSLVVSIYNNIQLGKNKSGSLISVQTLHGYFEIHDLIGYLIFEPDEVIFVQSSIEAVSCMIIGKKCTCSLFTNINKEILKSDFNTLDPAVLMSAMQLSLTESILQND
ncbi:hypothetical protein D9V86_00865 [Bacteroidetes/Chlorobi group bacterium ChocPot_Mid]|jgi:hypothetical protein|nr:MAG: hypothetical protein D9V86_00865 [Bacteroidetes/Chlorobi group bacterium ChocPot_Mid]